MELYLMQHGEAYPEEVDPERRLSADGEENVAAAGKALARSGVGLERIVSSPKMRAKQTAQGVAKAVGLPEDAIIVLKALEPLVSPQETLEAVKGLGEMQSILLAGHLPSLAEVAAYLMDCRGRIAFRMGGVCCLQVDSWNRGGGRLLWCLNPEQLRRIAG